VKKEHNELNTEKIIQACDLCGSSYQHGPHRYEGHKSYLYEIMVCDSCWQSNWDGWGPEFEKKLLSLLEDKGLPVPERNEKGYLPRG